MTDLEMVRLCAQAMGYRITETKDGRYRVVANDDGVMMIGDEPQILRRYNPLHDDAQAMALVKKFDLTLRKMKSPKGWMVADFGWSTCNGAHRGFSKTDLNRAIVECVAKMQKAKVTA